MFTRSSIAAVVLAASLTPVFADMRELSPVEFRQEVTAGHALGLDHVLPIVTEHVPGELVDVRVFAISRTHYHVTMKQDDGSLVAAIVNAQTGQIKDDRSCVAQMVQAAARTPSEAETASPPASVPILENGSLSGADR
ncbi:MAG: hypothetical protein AAFX00_04990 [Pseudomonadota bacterium]